MRKPVFIPILEYHDLGTVSGEKRSSHSPYVLDPRKFYDQLRWLRENGFQTISIDDLFDNSIPDKAVILTFDDGHISNYEIAFPILKKFHLRATFFLVSGFIGGKEYLSLEKIKEMQRAGMFFESHSVTHPYMVTLGEQDKMREIEQSKIEIQKISAKPVSHFCIPFGFYDSETVKCARNAGYRSLVTERIGYYRHTDAAFKVLPRFTIKANIMQQDFVNIIMMRRMRLFRQYLAEQILHGAKTVLGFHNYMRLKALLVKSSAP